MEKERIHTEQQFFDQAYSQSVRQRVDRFYRICFQVRSKFMATLADWVPGKRVLEIGCGTGQLTLALARYGAAQAVGIDISSTGLEYARRSAEQQGIAHRVNFLQMDAEALDFQDQSFDIVCGLGILHHLNLAVALPEIARVLNRSGRAIFIEPLGYHPLINWYRKRTPQLRTADEHPLKREEFALFSQYFQKVFSDFYYFSTLAAIPFTGFPGYHLIVRMLDSIDTVLFRWFPPLRFYAWQVLLRFEGPLLQ